MISTRCCLSLALVLALLGASQARVYDNCHLAQRLLRLDATLDEVASWVCLAGNLQPKPYDSRKQEGDLLGIFAINSTEWCGSGLTAGGKCNVRCSNLHDNNIADDFRCAQKVFREKGFEAWSVYTEKCTTPSTFVKGCKVGVLENNPFTVRRRSLSDSPDDSDYEY